MAIKHRFPVDVDPIFGPAFVVTTPIPTSSTDKPAAPPDDERDEHEPELDDDAG